MQFQPLDIKQCKIFPYIDIEVERLRLLQKLAPIQFMHNTSTCNVHNQDFSLENQNFSRLSSTFCRKSPRNFDCRYALTIIIDDIDIAYKGNKTYYFCQQCQINFVT